MGRKLSPLSVFRGRWLTHFGTCPAYDANGNVTVTINPLGYRWEYEYDARNRRVVERMPTVTETEIVGGQPVENPLTNPTILTAYDGVGNVVAVTDARGYITRSFYDQANRVTDVLTDPVSGSPATTVTVPPVGDDILVQTAYDANGNVTEVIDGNDNATRNQYDRLNRLVTTATNPSDGNPSDDPTNPNPGDITVWNTYDDAGNLVKVIDGGTHVTGFRYDGLGRKTKTIWDEESTVPRTEQATYDGVVQLTRVRNPGEAEEQTTTYEYDGLNRLQNILYTGAASDNLQYAYDLVGNLLAVSYPNDAGSVRESGQTFDKLNRLISETSAGVSHIHTYDKAGNRRTTAYANTARTLVSTYDKLNRLLTLTENTTAVTAYAYDLNGNVSRKTLPNGTESRCTFDALNRKLKEETLKSTGGTVSIFDYSQAQGGYPSGYDKAGNVLYAEEQYGHGSVNDRTVTNTYDHTYRLDIETIAETGGSTTVTDYGYDKANNRTSKSETINGGTPTVWTFTLGTFAEGYNSNQVKSVSDGTTTTTFLYDLNGNRTSKSDGSVTQSYTWDHENRLTQVVDSALGTFEYAYDHRTRRVVRDESGLSGGGQSAEISFSGGLSVQEYASDPDDPDVEYIRGSDYGGGIGGVLYTIRGTARSYNAYNSRGDVVSRTDDSEAITWQASYEAFGTRTQEPVSTPERQMANTKDEDGWGGLNEGLRYRDIEFGVFLSRDPAGFVDGPNVYAYVRQNPWTFYDPYGLNPFTDFLGGAWNAVSQQANDVVFGVGQAACIVEIAGREVGNAVAGTWGGSVDTDAGYDRLDAVTQHKESYGQEIQSGTAEVARADTASTAYKTGGYTVVAGEVVLGGVAVVKSGKQVVTAFKEGFEEGAKLAGNTARTTSRVAAVEAEAASVASRPQPHYTPDRRLPRTRHGDPIPDVDAPHSQLGRNRDAEPAAREWMPDDKGRITANRDIEFTDHGTPDIHPNPHQHQLTPNNPATAPRGGYQRGAAEPLENP